MTSKLSGHFCRGILLGILGGDVSPGSPVCDPISDQKMSFSRPFFKPGHCLVYGDKWQKSFEYAGQMWSSTGFGFRPYLVLVVYERSTLVDYIRRYVYVCWRRYGFLHRLLARRTKRRHRWLIVHQPQDAACDLLNGALKELLLKQPPNSTSWQMQGDVTLQSSAYGPSARHGPDQTSGYNPRSKSELDTSSARSR